MRVLLYIFIILLPIQSYSYTQDRWSSSLIIDGVLTGFYDHTGEGVSQLAAEAFCLPRGGVNIFNIVIDGETQKGYSMYCVDGTGQAINSYLQPCSAGQYFDGVGCEEQNDCTAGNQSTYGGPSSLPTGSRGCVGNCTVETTGGTIVCSIEEGYSCHITTTTGQMCDDLGNPEQPQTPVQQECSVDPYCVVNPSGTTTTDNQDGTSTTDNGDGTSTTDNGDGTSTTDNGDGTSTTDNGDGTSTTDNGDGTSTTDNGDGTSTTDNGDGTSTTDNGDGTSTTDNGDGTSTIDNGDGTTTTDNGDGTTTITDPDGNSTTEDNGTCDHVPHLYYDPAETNPYPEYDGCDSKLHPTDSDSNTDTNIDSSDPNPDGTDGEMGTGTGGSGTNDPGDTIDTDGDGEPDCNPTIEICDTAFKQNQERTCDEPPVCKEEDSYKCVTLRIQWESACSAELPDELRTDEAKFDSIGNKYNEKNDKPESDVDFSLFNLDYGKWSYSNECPAPIDANVLGTNITISFLFFCQLAAIVGILVPIIGVWHSTKLVIG